MTEAAKAIETTLRYAGKYGCVPGKNELRKRLLSRTVINLQEFEREVKKYPQVVEAKDENPWFLVKINKAQKMVEIMRKRFPGVVMVAVTGSVAARFPHKNDDIDLLVITKKDSLWLNRILIRVWVAAKGIPHRKYKRREKKDEFCFNMWLEEDSLLIPRGKRNLKNATDAILMIPLLNRNQTYEKFMKTNRWIGKYLATEWNRYKKIKVKKTSGVNNLVKAINFLCFWPQRIFMQGKMTRETVDLKRAFFHSR